MKVLLVGHTCSPGLGSEPGVSWNWAYHLAKDHQVWLVSHPQYRDNVEAFLRRQPVDNLRVVWLTLPSQIDPWDPRNDRRGLPLHYLLWLRKALRTCQVLHEQHRFDVVHHATMGTLSVPTPFWRLPMPCVWGALGGGQTTPSEFLPFFGKGQIKEHVRSARIKMLPHLPGFRNAVRNSAMVLATNDETKQVLEQAKARRVGLLLDTGSSPAWLQPEPPQREVEKEVTFLWCGRLQPVKCLDLALMALDLTRDLPIRLIVAGEGPEKARWLALTHQLNLQDRVQFLGNVPHLELQHIFRRANAFVFTSIRDSFGSVVLDAMCMGLPILTLNHQGVGTFVPAEAGIKVPVTTPNQTAAALADGFRQLATSPELRARLGTAAWKYAKTQTWDCRAAQMSRWYEELIAERGRPALHAVAAGAR